MQILVILVIIGILGIGTALYLQSKPSFIPGEISMLPSATQPQSTKQPISLNKTYQSKSIKFSVDLPNQYTIVEKMTFVNFIDDKGKINVSRIATNFDDLTRYLEDFDSKRSIKIDELRNFKISAYNAISRVELLSGGPVQEQKVCYIYVNGLVYSLSTSSKSLYDDLDQIAQTFQYIP